MKPGQELQITITSEPRAKAKRDTIQRLMRRDPAVASGLKRAQHLRRRRMRTYIRGGRTWYVREKCGKIAQVRTGETWTMTMTPDLEADLRSIESYVKIDAK